MTTYSLRSRLTDEPKPGKRISKLARQLIQRLRPAPLKPYEKMTEEELDRVSDI